MLGDLVSPESSSLSSMGMSVFERFEWLQQQVVSQDRNSNKYSTSPELVQMLQFHAPDGGELRRVEGCLGNNDELQSFRHFPMAGSVFGSNYNVGFVPEHDAAIDGCISRTSSCQMEPLDTAVVVLNKKEESRGTSLNKRKSEFKPREENADKKIKMEAETESSMKGKSNTSNTEAYSDTSKEASKVSETQKPDFIHVRARRGQATDKHSLAERARREKISKKMKFLQDLVPGCSKVTGKAGMLDEIINYVQSLQRQVEFLSMKLAVLNPDLEFDVGDLTGKQGYFTGLLLPPTSSKPSVMAGLASFPLHHQGSLDFPNQAPSLNAAISQDASSFGFHYC